LPEVSPQKAGTTRLTHFESFEAPPRHVGSCPRACPDGAKLNEVLDNADDMTDVGAFPEEHGVDIGNDFP
jgi:hypothetical protein